VKFTIRASFSASLGIIFGGLGVVLIVLITSLCGIYSIKRIHSRHSDVKFRKDVLYRVLKQTPWNRLCRRDLIISEILGVLSQMILLMWRHQKSYPKGYCFSKHIKTFTPLHMPILYLKEQKWNRKPLIMCALTGGHDKSGSTLMTISLCSSKGHYYQWI